METTEKIVESYCRYVRHWFTIPNIKCRGQYEIDLLAVDTTNPKRLRRYHVECGVSISGNYSKLTTKAFSPDRLKIRVQASGQRRTFGYFVDRKFGLPEVQEELKRYGFEPGNYQRIIVTWGAANEAKDLAKKHDIELWDFRNLLEEIAGEHGGHRHYFTDDTARTIQLYAMALKQRKIRIVGTPK